MIVKRKDYNKLSVEFICNFFGLKAREGKNHIFFSKGDKIVASISKKYRDDKFYLNEKMEEIWERGKSR